MCVLYAHASVFSEQTHNSFWTGFEIIPKCSNHTPELHPRLCWAKYLDLVWITCVQHERQKNNERKKRTRTWLNSLEMAFMCSISTRFLTIATRLDLFRRISSIPTTPPQGGGVVAAAASLFALKASAWAPESAPSVPGESLGNVSRRFLG